ncbi:MAG TPA: hypothetical protein VGE72_03520 [Azospirillum sp.]
MRFPTILCLAAAMAVLGACADETAVDRQEIMGDWKGTATAEQLADVGLPAGNPPGTLVIRFDKDEAVINGEPVKVTYTGVNNGFMIRPAGSPRVFTLLVRDHNRIRATFPAMARPAAVDIEMTRVGN